MNEQKQSTVFITGSGYVNKLNLEKNEEKDYIRGSISVRVDDENIVVFDVFEYKTNRNGKDNFKYKAFSTIMEEYIDSAKVDDYKSATKVFIGENKQFPNFPNATIGVDIYESQGTIQTRVKNKLALINRIKGDKSVYAGLKFDIKGFIVEELSPEYSEVGQETGRGILKGYIVDYNGIARPLEMIVIEEGFKNVRESWSRLNVLDLKGELINKKIEGVGDTTQPEGGFTTSKPKVEYKKEYLITDANITYESFNKEESNQAIAKLEELKNTLLSGESMNISNEESALDVEEDDIPF